MILKDEYIKRLQQAKEILENEYRTQNLFEQLPQKVGLTDRQLVYGFKKLFQDTPYNYLSTVRLKNAKELLLNTNLEVRRVAGMVGIHNDGHFVRWFKRITGSYPTDWRRNKIPKAGIRTIV
jgi:AraC family transcriptional regulator, transcriptional activator of the genes for pyochelin and ferripyochelin receptors